MSVDSQDTVDDLVRFLDSYYRDDIAWLAQSDDESLQIDWTDLDRYDTDLARDYISTPREVRELLSQAVELYDLPADVDLSGTEVRVQNLHHGYVHDVGESSPKNDRAQVRGLRGQVSQMTKSDAKIEVAVFECQRCGTPTRIPQSVGPDFQDPHECQGCERQGPFKTDLDASEFVDHQLIRLQTPPEEVTDRGTQTIDIDVESGLVNEVKPGERVVVFSELHLEQKRKGRQDSPYFDLRGRAESFERLESDLDSVEIEEYKEMFTEIADGEDTIEKIVESIAPSIKGYETIKEVIAYQLFGGVHKRLPDGSKRRGAIHTLLVGDPGLGKTQLIQYATNIAPRSIYTSGKGSTHAGLTAAAVQDDFGDGGWTIKAGALVKAHKGVAGIDELDKMDEEDRSGMLEAMSNQQISVTKVGKDMTLPAQTTVLAGANPTDGRFDDYGAIAEQVDLHPALISRFDLIFTLKDEADPERDATIAAHMNETARTGQKIAAGTDDTDGHDAVTPTIDPDVLRAYVAYARQECYPVLSDAADQLLQKKYIEIRTSNDDDGPIPTTPRILEAMQRLAEARARTRLSDTVTSGDVERVAEIMVSCLQDVGVDPETGELDADVIHSGQSKSQRERMRTVKSLIDELGTGSAQGTPWEKLRAEAASKDIDEEQLAHDIQKLKDTGRIYEPKEGHYRPA